MTEMLLRSPAAAAAPEPASPDIIRDALMDSRQRWRHLVDLAADLAFETDAKGRFVFVQPETALGPTLTPQAWSDRTGNVSALI
jgi:hypothetical protein